MIHSAVMKLPGPDHPITIAPAQARVRVTLAGKVVAESSRALLLKEAAYQPVFYIPREDADMTLLKRSHHSTYCPYKGDAGYYSIVVDGRTSENAVWTYEQPYPAMQRIAGHLAFYPSRVDAIEQMPL